MVGLFWLGVVYYFVPLRKHASRSLTWPHSIWAFFLLFLNICSNTNLLKMSQTANKILCETCGPHSIVMDCAEK